MFFQFLRLNHFVRQDREKKRPCLKLVHLCTGNPHPLLRRNYYHHHKNNNYLLALLATVNRFGKNLSPRLIWRTFQALGLLPSGKPQGLIYDSQTHLGIPFVLIEVRDKTEEAETS